MTDSAPASNCSTRIAGGGTYCKWVAFLLWIFCAPLIQADPAAAGSEIVNFNRDIRPLLSDRCFLCHGPDRTSKAAKKSKLRLDIRELAVGKDGAIVLGDAEASELMYRITTDDLDDRMPPENSHKAVLLAEEIELIRRWINQGAEYQAHWAFIPPHRPEIPAVKATGGVKTPIDAFVIARLESQGMSSAAEADRRTLIRRATLDLTGLPPTPGDIESFVNDPADPDVAFGKVIDRLLASKQYAEHFTRFWLDAARYADTSGYQYDRERTQWVWRDWVLNAFDTNMPFDRFTIEQTAGDLLPDATDQTRLATGFHRNHPVTTEGGVIDEEYRTEYVIDRVATTTTTWLGLTFACARCHDHKYDPISQKDFYSFFAFFNNVPERGRNGFDPRQAIPSPLGEKRMKGFDRKIAELQVATRKLVDLHPEWEGKLRDSLGDPWQTPADQVVVAAGGSTLTRNKDGSFLATGAVPLTETFEVILPAQQRVTAVVRLEVLADPSLTNGSTGRGSNGNFVLTEFEVEAVPSKGSADWKPVKVTGVEADYQQAGWPAAQAINGQRVGRQGWGVDGHLKHEDRTAVFTLADPIPAGSPVKIRLIQEFGNGHHFGKFRISTSPVAVLPEPLRRILAIVPAERSEVQWGVLSGALIGRFGDPESAKLAKEVAALIAERAAAITVTPPTMVLAEMAQPRTTYVLDRGEYDKPVKDEVLVAGVPEALGALAEGVPRNRLALAQWLVSKDQPLTARVTVNRFWQQFFGVGLVKTVEDFGSQGAWPSHPQLLDWLAVAFMESGWDVKRLVKAMVMSGTYRQSSVITEQAHAADPENRLLARGPRMRLDAETIRDSALAVSGTLDPTVGGRSVYPYHPQGLWLEINNRPGSSRAYPHSKNRAQLYRRSMYSFWKRTVPPPSMAAFDAPGREYCVVSRSRTNTPLQAFVMLHDPQFVEAARLLGRRMLKEGGGTIESRITFGFGLATARIPNASELAGLRAAFDARLLQYQNDPAAAEKLLSVGAMPRDLSIDVAEHAAYTQVARVLLNLSEFLTKG
jgi:hypothetical protein